MESENNTNATNIELLEKVPENTLKKALDYYAQSTKMSIYVRIPFFILAILFLIHNFVLAGKSYPINTYNTIKNTELTIVGILILIGIIMAGIAMSNNSKLKKVLIEISKRYHINIIKTQEEFNAIAVNLYGGNGFTFKI